MSDSNNPTDRNDDVLTEEELTEVVGGRSIRSSLLVANRPTVQQSRKALVSSGKSLAQQSVQATRKPRSIRKFRG